MNTVTQEYLKDFFYYKDGQLIRKKSMFISKIGSAIGGLNKRNGYMRATVNKKEFLLHRLIYLYHYGSLTDGLEIDHINGNRTDNRIENLRMVTRQHNQWNRKKDKGYCWDNNAKKFKAYIYKDNKVIRLGYFNTEVEAKNAYLQAKETIHKF